MRRSFAGGARRAGVFVWVGALALGCGGGTPEPRTVSASAEPELDVTQLLVQYGAEHSTVVQRPQRETDALRQAVRESRGSERLETMSRLAVAHMFAADDGDEPREAARRRRHARRQASRVLRFNRGRDRELAAEMRFVHLWTAWRGGSARAAKMAERFGERHRDAGELRALAWIIRGEVAFEREQWKKAADAYRYLLGQLEHPLYALALYRTAHCWKQLGRDDEAANALRQTASFACDDDASPYAARVSLAAAADLGERLEVLPGGRRRPASCARAQATGS